ncbi:hypothetical protein ES816_07440, partial [Salmonella enterica]|nr:hypothetical protein [Salmonella enterica]
ESPEEHVNLVINRISDKYYKKYGDNGNFLNSKHLALFKSVCTELGLESEYRDFGIACFINSADFERADIYFDRFIDKNLDIYSSDQILALLNGANKNNQCYWRNRSRNGNDSIRILKAAKDKLPIGFDFSIYDNLPVDKIDHVLEEDAGER